MRGFGSLCLTAGVAVIMASCAGRNAATGPGVDRNLLVQDQFADRGFHTAVRRDRIDALELVIEPRTEQLPSRRPKFRSISMASAWVASRRYERSICDR